MTNLQASELATAMKRAARDNRYALKCEDKTTGAVFYRVPSKELKGEYRAVYFECGKWRCECYYAQHGKVCGHIAAAYMRWEHDTQAAKAFEAATLPKNEDAILVPNTGGPQLLRGRH